MLRSYDCDCCGQSFTTKGPATAPLPTRCRYCASKGGATRRMALVRADERGLYVRAGGYVARPGEVSGYAHAYDMSAGNLHAGDFVQARHVAQTPLTRITLANGERIYWHHESRRLP